LDTFWQIARRSVVPRETASQEPRRIVRQPNGNDARERRWPRVEHIQTSAAPVVSKQA
jgi:hypothetical protein